MSKLISRFLFRFCTITPSNYSKVLKQFLKTQKLSAISSYVNKTNIISLLKVVSDQSIPPPASIQALKELCSLCQLSTQQDLNILANLKKQLGICHYQMGQFQEAVSEFEDGIKAILLLDNFEEFELAQYYYFTADIYLEMGNAQKAIQLFKESVNILKQFEGNADTQICHFMAIIHMKMAIGYIREELAQESRNELMKSMKYWADMPPGLSSDYEMTIRLKCKLHIYFNQVNDAISEAKNFLKMVNDKIVNKVLSQPNLIVFYKAFYLNLLKENGNEDDSNLYNAELQQLLHDFKSRNGDERLQQLLIRSDIDAAAYVDLLK